jgi:hypothetical protein
MLSRITRIAATGAILGTLAFVGATSAFAAEANSSPTSANSVESYVWYGWYPTADECSVYGVAWHNAHPDRTGWFCIAENGGSALYVDDGTTD